MNTQDFDSATPTPSSSDREHATSRHDAQQAPATAPRESHTEQQRRRDLEAIDEVQPKKGSTTAGVWIALILGAAILILLLIFVVQNNVTANFDYLSWQFSLPLGVAMLLAAIAGALIMALVGSVRIMQLSWELRKYRKQEEKLLSALHR